MSAATFTPGPWHAVHSPIGTFGTDYRQIHAQNGAVVSPHGFQRSRDGETWTEYGCVISEADARLIAAAPELLEACCLALKSFGGRAPNPNAEPATFAEWRAITDAIAKAEGK